MVVDKSGMVGTTRPVKATSISIQMKAILVILSLTTAVMRIKVLVVKMAVAIVNGFF